MIGQTLPTRLLLPRQFSQSTFSNARRRAIRLRADGRHRPRAAGGGGHLDASAENAARANGVGVAVNWPVGTGGRGSSGVAAIVTQTPGAIGYADVAYAKANHLKFFAVKNRSGKFTTPGLRGIKAAATSDQKPTPGTNELSIVNPPRKFALAYPISTFTYVIVPQQSGKAPELKKFLFWAVTKGQAFGPKLLFQPIPKSVLVVAEKTIGKIHG